MDGAAEFTIDADSELRFETQSRQTRVTCRLQQGQASCFGTPLEKGVVYTYPEGTKAAVYSREGAVVQLRGHRNARTGSNSGARFDGVVQALRDMRAEARRTGSADAAPRVMIAGPTDSGKSTLCKHLLNDATQSGDAVTFVDCDLGQNSVTCPGSVAAAWLEAGVPVDMEEGLNLLSPLAFFFGDLSVNPDNLPLYHHLCTQTYACIKANQCNRVQFRPGGVVINTMGWTTSHGYSALKLIAAAFDVNVVVVMNEEKLAEELRADLSQGGISAQVVELRRPDGVTVRQQNYRREQRGLRVKEYFCGVKTRLAPARCVVSFDQVRLFRHSGRSRDPSAGFAAVEQRPSAQHQLCVAAVSHAAAEEDVAHANVAGFVVILAVNAEQREITLLSPNEGPPPKPFLLVSNQKMAYEDTLST
eukprot:TRINITY_DN4249_c0_g3_i1.p1 TRINITY_DN4249_c0_g3~~TRINITY_DN4249_c0_g3_i1.p1  ORF type:complete len:444 (+),score=163.71 TRINITY_DN4249_c0_g3_i1:80-1333(+)